MREEADPNLVELAKHFLTHFVGAEHFEQSGLERTPERFVNMLTEMLVVEEGRDEFEITTFKAQNNQMVVMHDIPFYSMCAHHLAPFFGVCHIAYIPDEKVVGLSKLPRSVKFWSKGLWSQEDLTDAIAQFLVDHLEPLGVGVVMRGRHLCMEMRGVQTPGAETTTSAMKGVFLDPDRGARNEFLQLINPLRKA